MPRAVAQFSVVGQVGLVGQHPVEQTGLVHLGDALGRVLLALLPNLVQATGLPMRRFAPQIVPLQEVPAPLVPRLERFETFQVLHR